MFKDKNMAALTFALMVTSGLFAILGKGDNRTFFVLCSGVQAYWFIRFALDHFDARQVKNNKADARPPAEPGDNSAPVG